MAAIPPAVHPDVVVGVDFGMTSTGVAYSAGPEWMRPETIQKWPSTLGGSIADKVDTKIAYNSQGEIVSWGFMVDNVNINSDYFYEELFKLYLDPDFEDPYAARPSLQEARKWFTDYLSCIYQAVDRHLRSTIPRYDTKKVEFRFSVPTTWRNPAMIAEMEQLIRNSGFGRLNTLHTAEIGLTEAEAAAVYASKQQYGVGDVFMVADCGGGTTDVNILKVVSTGVGQTELQPLSFVEGRAIGSTLIGFRMEKLIAQRLGSIRPHLDKEPEVIARRMMNETSRFESFKCNLGDDAMDLPALRLQIPGLESNANFEGVRIEKGQMILLKSELQAIFETQIEKIIALIDDQLRLLERKSPSERVTYLVLSGGLGSSPYLQKRLRSYYELGRSGIQAVSDLQILQVPKPQLAVCHGLVLDRVQQIKENRAVYKERFCRNSYGVLCRNLYNADKHAGEPIKVDPRDGKQWVERQIDWFIVQGEKVSVEAGVKQHYNLKVTPGKEHIPWKTEIVMSSLPRNKLPRSLNQAGASRVCQVLSQLPPNMKMKNRHWYNSGPKYLRGEFDMKVIIGPADLKFETYGANGLLSQTHDNIDVEWASPAENQSHTHVSELPGGMRYGGFTVSPGGIPNQGPQTYPTVPVYVGNPSYPPGGNPAYPAGHISTYQVGGTPYPGNTVYSGSTAYPGNMTSSSGLASPPRTAYSGGPVYPGNMTSFSGVTSPPLTTSDAQRQAQ